MFACSFVYRRVTPRSNKFSGYFASNSLVNGDSNHPNPNPNSVITFQDPSTQNFFK